jgi:hypothetical protein
MSEIRREVTVKPLACYLREYLSEMKVSAKYLVINLNYLEMKRGKQPASEKRKERAKPRNHPRSKSEKISIKRPEPDQDKNPVPDSHDDRVINPNVP